MRQKFYRYGLREEEYNRFLLKQKGKCGICEKVPDKGFHVDHCHDTGKVRGLLCPHCNLALGNFFNCPLILTKAIQYLGYPV